MFIGLDLGTSGVRALLVRDDGTPVSSAEAPLSVSHPQPGWSEQNPSDWCEASALAIDALGRDHPEEIVRLKGIGISGQMHGATLIDSDGKVLRPCMLWNDTRSHEQAARLDRVAGFRDISGNIVFPGFTAPKLLWVAENEPEVFAQVARVLLPKDYLSFWLTGRAVSDMSDSSGTGWLDVGARQWSEKLLKASGMRPDQMPELLEGTGVVGPVRDAIADRLGLPRQVLLVAGGGDNAAAACGVGALGEGDGFVSLGTSGVLLAARNRFEPDPQTAVHTFCHAVPERWYHMGVILAATDSLNWLSGILGIAPAAMTAALGENIGAPGAVRFLPYLSGERTPHNDSRIRGAFSGLDIATGPEDLTRAVLEGVSFALRDSFEALASTGVGLSRALAIGGGTRSRHWVELLATVLNIPVDLPEAGDFGAALGAARLAICGIGNKFPDEVMIRPPIAETVLPRADLTSQYEDAYQTFSLAYPLLKAMQ